MMRVYSISLLTLLALGCAATPNEKRAAHAVDDYLVGDFDSASKRLEPLAKKPDSNFVLNNLRLGSASLHRNDLDGAEAAFLRAHEVIDSFGVNGGSRAMAAVLVHERAKVWRGEPYEQAMANFYLGLVYYIRHDYNNARAAFENAELKLPTDKFAKSSPFLLAELMRGRALTKLGETEQADATFANVAQNNPALKDLADAQGGEDSNLLLVVEYGQGPERQCIGDGSKLGFYPTPTEAGNLPQPVVRIDGREEGSSATNVPCVDLVQLAQLKDRKSIDRIRSIKSKVGDGLLIAGGAETLHGADAETGGTPADLVAGSAMLASGVLLKAGSHPDLREWEMLPRSIFLLPISTTPGTHEVTIHFPDAPEMDQTWKGIPVPETGEATYLFRVRINDPGPYDWQTNTPDGSFN